MLNLLARARLELYLQRLDYHLSDLPRSHRRQIRREIRDNLSAAPAASAGVELGGLARRTMSR
jgi:hypothetical protein